MRALPIRLGLSDHHQSLRLYTAVRDFARVFGQMARRPIAIYFSPDYERLLEGVLLGGVDLAWMPPRVHARAVAAGGLLAAVIPESGERIPSDGFVLSAPMSGWKQARLRDLLLGLHHTTDGASALRRLLGAERLAPVASRFF